MNEENELEKLVIKNLDVVEHSRKLLPEIDRRFRNELENILVPQIVYFFPTWEYTFGLDTKWCNIDVYPKHWIFGSAFAQFSIDFHKWEGYDKLLTYLSFCTNIENVEPGIFFNLNREFLEKFAVDFRKEIYSISTEDKERLDAADIKLKNGRLFRPFQLDLDTISADWPNLTADSIKPLLDALQSVSQVTDIFDDLVKRLTGQK